MPKQSRYPSWEQFEEYVSSGTPLLQEIAGEPRLELSLGRGAEEMGLLIPVASDIKVMDIPLKEIHVHKIKKEGEYFLSVHTKSPALFKPFFHLVAEISDSIQLKNEAPIDAITKAIREWDAMLRKESLLTEQMQTGLFGELIILEMQIKKNGPGLLDSWTGPIREPHDFRMVPAEFEVKTTKGNSRHHIIGSLAQLVPSKDCKLYLVSVVLESAGNSGDTLPDRVSRIRELLKVDLQALVKFDDLISGPNVGYRDKDAVYYSGKYRMRVPLSLIYVNKTFPKITRYMLEEQSDKDVASRILDVNYTVDVEGLGVLEGTDEFTEVFYQ